MGGWKQNSLGGWYRDDEYRSPNAGTVYKAPKKKKTEGEKLEESGEYLQDPETQDTSKPLESKSFDINPKKHKQAGKTEKIFKKATNPQAQGSEKDWVNRTGPQLPPILESREMDEVYSRDKELYGEFDRIMEEARNATGRDKKALLQRAGRIRKRIETGVDPMTIGEFGYKVAETLLPDLRNPAEVAEFTLDAAMAVKSGGVIPAAKLLTKKTIGKKAIKEILNWDLDKARRLVFGDTAQEVVDAGTGMTMKIDDVDSVKPLQMTGSGAKEVAGSIESVTGTAKQRMSDAIDRLKKGGYLRRDGSIRRMPTVTSRARGRSGNADLVNAFSDRTKWNKEGNKAIKEVLDGLTAREQRLAGKWHKHHKRPLSQNSWLVQGLEGEELAKAHKYSYQRMAAGGDVLDNQRIIFDKAHDATHAYMNQAIGEMRAGAGKSIQGLLDPGMNPQDFLKLKTFEERKFAMSRFFDVTDRADKKIQHIIDAMNSAKTKGATISISDANSFLNKVDFDNFNKIDDISDIAILDDFIKDLNKLMDPEDINSLNKINEKLNANEATWLPIATELEPLQKIIDDGGKLSRAQKTKYNSLTKKSDLLEVEANDLIDRKDNLLPKQAVRKYQNSLERIRRGSTPGNTAYPNYEDASQKGIE